MTDMAAGPPDDDDMPEWTDVAVWPGKAYSIEGSGRKAEIT